MLLKNLLSIFLLLFSMLGFSQTTETLADYEAGGLSPAVANSFGNGHFSDSTFSVIENPNKTGINTSDSVRVWMKANDGNTWGGFYIDLVDSLDFTGAAATMCIDVMFDHAGILRMKLEKSGTGPDLSHEMNYTTANQWEKLCFDFTLPDPDGDVGSGHKYPRVTLFFDFGTTPAADAAYYFDNLTKTTGGAVADPDLELIYDWEMPDTNMIATTFGNGHFGSDPFGAIANPASDTINGSDSVYQWCKANDANTWGGFFFNVDTVDFSGSKATICIDYYADATGMLSMKMEKSGTGPDLFTTMPYTNAGSWEQICFDFSVGDDDGDIGLGHIYERITFFPDFGIVPANDKCFSFDNLLKITNGLGGAPSDLLGTLITNSPDHTMLKNMLDSTDLWSVVNLTGVTFFAPTDAAFNALPANELSDLQNNVDNAAFNMILHHAVFDSLPADLLVQDMVIISRNGQDIKVTTTSTGVDNANISTADVLGVNGIMHVVDAVLAFPTDPAEYLHFDYESPETAPVFLYFGDVPQSHETIANPASDAANNSATVAKYVKYPFGQTWQGAFIDLERPINLFNDHTELCMDVWFDHAGFLRIKMESSPTGVGDSRWVAETQVVNGWNQICWDLSTPDFTAGLDANNHIFNRLSLFFDFENSAPLPPDTTVYYIDNFIQRNPNATGINKIDLLKNFNFYPNPTTGKVIIESDTEIESAAVLDIAGKKLIEVDNPVLNNVDISHLTAGMYFIQFFGENNRSLGSVKVLRK